ncbi:MAG: bifunctional phosphoribosylaminoimidazolecarboxamide formyltransferase/IMP cyclohydrolase [Candidatus Thermoplasmatota archaeon]
MDFIKVKVGLISAWDKSQIVDFSKKLCALNVELIATEGTCKFLKEKGIDAKETSAIAGMPEMLNGRVKSIHPKIFSAILAQRDKKAHMEELKKYGIKPIDLIFVSLYPYQYKSSIDYIDIGGVALIRAGAKNYNWVVTITEPKAFEEVLKEIEEYGGVSIETSRKLASYAFFHTSKYDSIIANGIYGKNALPPYLGLNYRKFEELRYGENPNQLAAIYEGNGKMNFNQIHGIKLSYNNLLDLETAYDLCMEFKEPSVAVIKHTNPCGVASSTSLEKAFLNAVNADRSSAYGSIIGINRKVDIKTAERMDELFIECVIAPDYDENALKILKKKKRLRIISLPEYKKDYIDVKKVFGYIALQKSENSRMELKVVSKRKPTKNEIENAIFAWKVVKYVKSNGIVLAKNFVTLGIGAGQMSRVDSVKIAVNKAGRIKGTVMASDGFFPFRDAIETSAAAGVKCIIQPGGSIRDDDIIRCADELKISMLFTNLRCFRH